MGDGTKIEWSGATWNAIRGCQRTAPEGSKQSGCGDPSGGGCYAERQAARFCGPGGAYEGLINTAEWDMVDLDAWVAKGLALGELDLDATMRLSGLTASDLDALADPFASGGSLAPADDAPLEPPNDPLVQARRRSEPERAAVTRPVPELAIWSTLPIDEQRRRHSEAGRLVQERHEREMRAALERGEVPF